MRDTINRLLAEVRASDDPAASATFIVGYFAGEVTKHTGNSKFAALMMIIAKAAKQERPGYQPVHSIIDQTMEDLASWCEKLAKEQQQ